MLKNRIKNFNIDILAKDYNSFTPNPAEWNQSKDESKNRLIDINYVRIESKLDFKKIKNSNSSKIGGGAISSQGKHSQLILKRNRYKLMRL